MVITGWGEEAAAAAQPPLMPRSGPGQNDAGAPSFLAWRRNAAAGAALEACLALLLAVASQIMLADGIRPAPALQARLARVSEISPPAKRPYDASIAALAASLGREVTATA
jgi:hypothetical protein